MLFTALVLPTVGEGVSSWDSHKIQVAVRALLDGGTVMLSRPPGHPTTEFFLFGGIGWVVERWLGGRFNETLFLTMQWLVALGVAAMGYAWLRRTGLAAVKALLVVSALLFSPQFLDQTVNGEEILYALLFLFSALFVLAGGAAEKLSGRRIAAAIALFALAVGCRAEFVLCGAVFLPVALIQRGVRDGRTWTLAVAGSVVAVALVWSPVLPVIWRDGSRAGDVADIHGAPVILVWGYKVIFRSFGFPVSLVLVAASLLALKDLVRAARPWAKREWMVLGVLLLVAMLLGLFLWQPGKPAYMLVCLPFLLWLVAQRAKGWLVGVAALTAIGACVGVDIFRDRELTKPHLVPGAYRAAIGEKPARRLAYITQLARTEVARKSAIVGDAWSWVYEHHLERGNWPARRERLQSIGIGGYRLEGDPERIVLPREATFLREPLRRAHEAGYEIVMDRTLWRTLYARYQVTLVTGDQAMIGRIPVRLVDVDDRE